MGNMFEPTDDEQSYGDQCRPGGVLTIQVWPPPLYGGNVVNVVGDALLQ